MPRYIKISLRVEITESFTLRKLLYVARKSVVMGGQ